MMFPSLRGGNDNPGAKEGFLGEVDDVIAAADFLAKQPYVDPPGSTSAATAPAAPSRCSSPNAPAGSGRSSRSVPWATRAATG